jgi:hypothetical protein
MGSRENVDKMTDAAATEALLEGIMQHHSHFMSVGLIRYHFQ